MNALAQPILLVCVVICLLGTSQEIKAQEVASDSLQLTKKEIRKLKRAKRNFRFSVLGGPGFTPDLGFLVGGSALSTFKIDKTDSLLPRSVIPFAFAIIFNGGFTLSIRPQLFFKKDKSRLFGDFIYRNTLDHYYGVGFERNKNTPRSDSTTQFRTNEFLINPIYLIRVGKSDLFLGPIANLVSGKMKSPSEGIVSDPNYEAEGGTASGLNYFVTGLGASIRLDTRDIPANPYKGYLFDLRATFNGQYLGGSYNFTSIFVDYRQYQLLGFLGRRKVLAWMAQATNQIGDVPITQLAGVGSPFDLRGYYLGQFRNKSTIFFLAEYRHMFNFKQDKWIGRMGSKLGFVVWGGVGGIGPQINQLEGGLPNAGVGIRIEMQPRMNFRVDFGRDFVNGQTLFYLNMTEAF